MYSLLSVLVQGEVREREMREGMVKDELLSQMPHFMGYISCQKKKKTLKMRNLTIDWRLASREKGH